MPEVRFEAARVSAQEAVAAVNSQCLVADLSTIEPDLDERGPDARRRLRGGQRDDHGARRPAPRVMAQHAAVRPAFLHPQPSIAKVSSGGSWLGLTAYGLANTALTEKVMPAYSETPGSTFHMTQGPRQ
ncbi:hypothetical protein [Micromonospora echinospora]|uniref:hypothetical protein n=1 Tax=Micromonospora echinospora TaxID=1877 RepID=UPI00117EB5A0|nr:hypothetical protein [Micromonospora echinospora]